MVAVAPPPGRAHRASCRSARLPPRPTSPPDHHQLDRDRYRPPARREDQRPHQRAEFMPGSSHSEPSTSSRSRVAVTVAGKLNRLVWLLATGWPVRTGYRPGGIGSTTVRFAGSAHLQRPAMIGQPHDAGRVLAHHLRTSRQTQQSGHHRLYTTPSASAGQACRDAPRRIRGTSCRGAGVVGGHAVDILPRPTLDVRRWQSVASRSGGLTRFTPS